MPEKSLLSDAPNLMLFLNTSKRNLIDEFSITANLNLDLKGFVYPGSPQPKAVDAGESSPQNDGFKLEEALGDQIIDLETVRIITFDPQRGYLVRWSNCSEPTWHRQADMPVGMYPEMLRAQEEYRKTYKNY